MSIKLDGKKLSLEIEEISSISRDNFLPSNFIDI